MDTKRLTTMAMLLGISLSLFIVEAQIPLPIALPGIKLGLANVVTVYAMFVLGAKDTFVILLARIVLGSIFAGRLSTLMYSFVGGMMCYFVMFILHKVCNPRQIWICSIFGAMAHVTGQILVAIFFTDAIQLVWYLPVLLLAAMATGAVTGSLAQIIARRFPLEKF